MKHTHEPYRFLFPVGTAISLIGVGVWLLRGLPYPGGIHARLMVEGFLLSFVAGFLMTAIPKMTGGPTARRFEIGLALTAVLGTSALSLLGLAPFADGLTAIVFLGLAGFGFLRVRARKKVVPQFFVFVASGMLGGFVGSAMLALSALIPELGVWGRLILFQIPILSFVLGVGCRLMPVICGLKPLETNRSGLYLGLATLLWLSVFVEATGFPRGALLIRAATVLTIATQDWRLFQRPKNRSRVAWMMKASGVMVLAGMIAAAVQPALALHWMHLTYVGGFGLMTFAVASRVTLAHGGFDLVLEADSKSILVLGGFVLLAALTRAVAPLVPGGYDSHLRYAALCWLIGVTCWCAVFIRRIFRVAGGSRC